MPIKLKAQIAKIKSFGELHRAEKWWIITHLFIVKKTLKISGDALLIANTKINDPDLDADFNGGQVDAFRHTLWMAMLAQKISVRSARKLGQAHEKGNRKDFEDKILEEGKLPDSISCVMDLLNNDIGIELGRKNKKLSNEKLVKLVKQYVLEGKCWKIRKDQHGNFLDSFGGIIPKEQWFGIWNSPKVLVPSNYR